MPEVIRVLYIEEGLDEKIASRVLEESLTDLTDYLFIFTVVSNPFIGLEQTQYSSFDIIICQECPYGLDAYEFTRILRNLGEFTPIVVLTNDDEMLQWNKEIKKRIPTTPHGERGERLVASIQGAENALNLKHDVAEKQSSFSRIANTRALRRKMLVDDGYMSMLKKPYTNADLQNVMLESIALRNEKNMPDAAEEEKSADLVRREIVMRLHADMEDNVHEKVKEAAPYILELEEGGDTAIRAACNKKQIEIPKELEDRFTEAQKLDFEKLPFQSARFHHESTIKSRLIYEEKMNYAMLKKINPRGKNKKRGAEMMTHSRAQNYDQSFYHQKYYGMTSPGGPPNYGSAPQYSQQASRQSAPTIPHPTAAKPMSPTGVRVQADFSDLADPAGEPGALGDLLSAVNQQEEGYTNKGPVYSEGRGAMSPDNVSVQGSVAGSVQSAGNQSHSSYRSLGSVSLGNNTTISRQDSLSSAPGEVELDTMVKAVLGNELEKYASQNTDLQVLMEADPVKFKATANQDPVFRNQLAQSIEEEVTKYKEKKRQSQVLETLMSMQEGQWRR